MKAFRQIDLTQEKRFVWTTATLLSLAGILFMLYPMKAYSANSTGLSKQIHFSSQKATLSHPFQSSPSLSRFIESSGLSQDLIHQHLYKLTADTNSAFSGSQFKSALPLLFTSKLHQRFWWEWNPADSSIKPVPLNRYILSSLNSNTEKDFR